MTPRAAYTAKAVLLDIEGTIAAQSFVAEVLFPYARAKLADYLGRHETEPEVAAALEETRRLAPGIDPVTALFDWIDRDVKAPPLKFLQGRIWRQGYEDGVLKGHLYEDACAAMTAWRRAGIPLYIYSSGSVEAQLLLFRHNEAGDLTGLFAGHFDTNIGPKVEAESYARIARRIETPAGAILFLSDNPRELAAARQAGLQAVQVVREATVPDPDYAPVTSLGLLKVGLG